MRDSWCAERWGGEEWRSLGGRSGEGYRIRRGGGNGWIDGRMGEGEVDELRRRRGPARLRKRRGAGNGWVFLIPLGSRVGSVPGVGGNSDTFQTHDT